LIDPEKPIKYFARMGWIITIDASEPLMKAMELMVENKIRHLPVVSAKKLMGFLSVRDIIDVLGAVNANVLLREESKRFMSGKVIASSPDEPLWRALSVMKEADIGALPIVNDEDEVQGIFTERDVVTDVAPELSWEGSVERLANERPKTIESGATLADVISMMNEIKVRHLPVVSGKRLEGIVTSLGIIKYVLDHRKELEKGTIFGSPVSEVMEKPVYVSTETPLSEAIDALGRSPIDAVVVVGDDLEVQGLFTDRDVLKETARVLEKLERP